MVDSDFTFGLYGLVIWTSLRRGGGVNIEGEYNDMLSLIALYVGTKGHSCNPTKVTLVEIERHL